jgi:broad specificity phosphatase PhoE
VGRAAESAASVENADFVPPNGEDWSRFHARVAKAFAFIVSRRRAVNGITLVVVTMVWSAEPWSTGMR